LEVALVLLVYLVVCRLLELLVLLARGDASKDLEIVVLRHEFSILRRQAPRPAFTPGEGLLLSAFSRVLPRRSWHLCLVCPEALLGWHRRLVAQRSTYPHRSLGRPPVDGAVRRLIVRLARENTGWG
jgi:putative transposase